MFRRKDEDETMATTTDVTPAQPSTLESAPTYIPPTPSQPVAAAPIGATPAYRPAPPQQATVLNQHRAAPATAPYTAAPDHRSTSHLPSTRTGNKRVLTVGPDIQMKGEITTCDRVIIEGVVDATLRDVHTVELSESGELKGTAEVEDAEISGNFEGDLTVRGKLTIYSAGRVRGNVTYGEIEIQRGGQISGNVRNVADAKLPSNQNQPKMKVA